MKTILRRVPVILPALAVVGIAASAAGAAGQVADAHHASAARHAVSGLDVEWLKTSAQGDVFEIRGGHIALQKSSNSAVKALAQRLIKDHTKSLRDAEKLAAKHGIKLEKTPTPSQQWELSMVSSLSGKTFDTAYSSLEVGDHHQDISETTDEERMGFNREVVKDAKKEIPMLRMHLHLSKVALASAQAEAG